MIFLRCVSRAAVDHRCRARLLRGVTLDGIDVDDDSAVTAHGLVQGETHEPESAGANDHRRFAGQRRDFFQGTERGDAGAGERGCAVRRKVADVEQIARMRHHQVVGIAAVREHAETAHGAAEILVSALARAASPATDPRMRQPAVADLDALRVGADRHHLADILVTEGHRQFHAAIREAHLFAAAQIEPAVGQMQITVADAGCQNLQQDFAAGRLGRWLFVELERLAANADLEHAHWTFSRIFLSEPANHSPLLSSLPG